MDSGFSGRDGWGVECTLLLLLRMVVVVVVGLVFLGWMDGWMNEWMNE